MRDFLLIVVGIAALIGLKVLFGKWREKWLASAGSRSSAIGAPSQAYFGLRNQIFDGTFQRELVPSDLPHDEPWGVVMDWGVGRGVATIVALRDGTASMYYSSGGGNLGGGQADAGIRAAAKNALTIAAKHLNKLGAVSEFPIPAEPEQVFFYALTPSGIYFGEGSQKELSANQHPLSELGNAMQEIVTGYRLYKPQRS